MKKTLYIVLFIGLSTFCKAQLSVEHTVYFDLDKDTFVNSEGVQLDTFLDDLIYKPILEIKILGYCDDRGSKEYNLDLSNRRVETVSRWLVAHDIKIQNITKHVEGLGEIGLTEEHLDDEDLERTRAKNRRVDVTFLLSKKVEDRLSIKKITQSSLNNKEKEVIDAYETAAIDAVNKNPDSKEKIIIKEYIEKPEEFLDVPTRLNPPIDNGKEPFKSLLSMNLKEGQVIRLDNILFYKGRSTILEESLPLLDRMAEILVAREDIEFEIHGHVCCINAAYPDAYNRDTKKSNLSHDRAQAIFQILRKRGVDYRRMKFKGYGRSKPLGGPDKQDRRVELIVTKIKK